MLQILFAICFLPWGLVIQIIVEYWIRYFLVVNKRAFVHKLLKLADADGKAIIIFFRLYWKSFDEWLSIIYWILIK